MFSKSGESNHEAMAVAESTEEAMITEDAPPQPVAGEKKKWVKKSREEYALYLADELGDKAINFLECIGCKLTISEGVSRCDGGHTLCQVCVQNLHGNMKCPACAKKVERRTALESFFSFFPWHHCHNEEIGCRHVFLGTKTGSIEEHEATCPFNSLRGIHKLTVE